MIIDDEDSLKSWIIKDVASLTDADADRLALYVIALLKKPLADNDLVELCSEKLDVFLQAHTKDFVDRLFESLKSGSYMPDGAHAGAIEDLVLTDGSDQEEDPETKWDSEVQETKSTSKSVDREEIDKFMNRDTLAVEETAKRASSADKLTSSSNNGTSRATRRRISPPPSDRHGRNAGTGTQRFSPSRSRRSNVTSRRSPPRGRSERYHRRRSYSRSRSRSRSPYREKRRDDHDSSSVRRRCRDFHEKGFCMRGDKCNYDHGPDPVVIENSALEKIVNRSASNAITPPVTSSSLYSPGNPPPPGVEKGTFSPIGEGFSAETPALVPETTIGKLDFSVPPPPLPPHLAATALPTIVQVLPSVYSSTIAPSSSALVTVVPNMQTVQAYNPTSQGIVATSLAPTMTTQMQNNYNVYGNASSYAPRGSGAFGRRGRGRFKPYGAPLVNPALCSLLVKKIPPEQNKIVLLDQHFGKFGQITNLHVQYEGQPDTALVTFKTRREALNAYKSTEPIFNNRFIKVFWQTQPEVTATENGAEIEQQQQQQPVQPPDISSSTVPVSGDATLNNVKKESLSQDQTNEGGTVNAEVGDAPTDGAASLPNIGPKRGIYNPRAVAAAAKKKAEREAMLKLVELHRLKTELYQKQIEQQKELLQRIQNTDNKETKKKIMELVKKSEESMKIAKADIESLNAKISAH